VRYSASVLAARRVVVAEAKSGSVIDQIGSAATATPGAWNRAAGGARREAAPTWIAVRRLCSCMVGASAR